MDHAYSSMIVDVPRPRLPGEVTDQIIPYVEHQATLLSCCLVCSNWLPASRHRLFQKVVIDDPYTYDLLVSNVLHSDTLHPYLSSVLEVFFDEYPHHRFKSDGQVILPLNEPSKIILFIQEFAGHMPNLTKLTLGSTKRLRCPPHPGALMAFSNFPSLRELTLVGCHFPYYHALRRALSALPSLTSLGLIRVSWPQPYLRRSPMYNLDAHKPLRMSLSSLVMTWPTKIGNRRCAHQFVTWLSATSSPLTLRSLRLAITETGLEAGQGYLRVFGPTLQRLCRCVTTLDVELLPWDHSEGSSHRAMPR